MKDDSKLVKDVLKALRPMVNKETLGYTARRAAFAIARAYRADWFTVPIQQLTDEDLFTLRGFGPKMLALVREIIPRPGEKR